MPIAAWAAKEPGPYVAVQVDYFTGPADAADPAAGTKVSEGRGSGVVIGPGDTGTWIVLTNAHVVEADSDSWRPVPRVYAGGQWRDGAVIASDAEADLALVQVEYADSLRAVSLATAAPGDRTNVKTHGFAAGRKYTARDTRLNHALALEDGALAYAPKRYFMQTTFTPGESGGAVTVDGRLVGLIHGNDPDAKRGICVDFPAIERFLESHLPELKTADAAE
jgi:S1-C subfamily serine protease